MSTDPVEYSHRLHAFKAYTIYRLHNDILTVTAGQKAKSYRLDEIAGIRLSSSASRIQTLRYIMAIELRSGNKLSLTSEHFKTMAMFENRIADYVPFVRALHQRLAERGDAVTFKAGKTIPRFSFMSLFILAIFGCLYWLIPVIMQGHLSSTIWLKLVLLGILIPTFWLYVRRNWPTAYEPTHIPRRVLPKRY